jgi:hemerythrin
MAYMKLSETYRIGMQSIDEEHGNLMDLINQAHEALRASAPRDEVEKMFQRLAACASTHFWQEEALFVGTGYPDAILHTRKHEHLTMILSCFERGTDRMGRSVSFEDQLSFLRDWLLDHIANEDKDFSDYLGAQTRPKLSAAA